jgi:hypothetical protein
VQALPPTVTVAPDTKFVPVIVIDVPPAALPVAGEIEVIVGRGSYLNPEALVAVSVFAFVTTTSTSSAFGLPAGVVQVIDVSETTSTLVQALPPTVTVAPISKLLPVIVMAVPPALVPLIGEIRVIVGDGV